MQTTVLQWIIMASVSITSVVVALYFSNKSSKATDRQETKADTTQITSVSVKLNMILDSLDEIKEDNKETRRQMIELRERTVKTEESVKQAHHRINELVVKGGAK